MKTKFTLDENDTKEAIRRYVKQAKKIDVKDVYLRQHIADTSDPREYSYFYAEVSE